MKKCKDMTRGELRRHVEQLARAVAARAYRRLLPGASEDDVWHYAGRNWRHYRDRAVNLAVAHDLLAGRPGGEGASVPPARLSPGVPSPPAASATPAPA